MVKRRVGKESWSIPEPMLLILFASHEGAKRPSIDVHSVLNGIPYVLQRALTAKRGHVRGAFMLHRVFVYGTLKDGFPNFSINLGQRIAGNFRTVQRLSLYLVGDRHSPWLVHADGQGMQVEGQVFEADENVLKAMDKLERIDMPDGYRRVKIQVVASNDLHGTPFSVHVYLKPAQMLQDQKIMLGPLAEYELSHAVLYTPRAAPVE